MKYAIILALFAVGCAARAPKQDPAVAVLNTHGDIERSGKTSDDAIKNLQRAIERTEKQLEESEREPK